MNTNPLPAGTPAPTVWARLVLAARRARFADVRDIPAPYGFATRIAARALHLPPTAAGPFFVAKLTLRMLGVACLLAIISVTFNLGSILHDIDDEAASLATPAIESVEPDAPPSGAPAAPL